jgi:hypothetical protein
MNARTREDTQGSRPLLFARDETLLPPARFHDRLVEKLGDLMIAAGDLVDTVTEATSARCAAENRTEHEIAGGFQCATAARVKRTAEQTYDTVDRLLREIAD